MAKTLFKKGNPGGPGRPKGSKHSLSEDYLKAMAADFAVHGEEVIEQVRIKKPDVYLKCIAMLVPKDYRIESEVHHFVIKATPELTVDQWRTLHQLSNAKDIKALEVLQ
jgi:hypothetical protein